MKERLVQYGTPQYSQVVNFGVFSATKYVELMLCEDFVMQVEMLKITCILCKPGDPLERLS